MRVDDASKLFASGKEGYILDESMVKDCSSESSPIIDLKNLDLEELQKFLEPLGKEKFRARQVIKWLYQKNVNSFSEMTNLSKSFQNDLAQRAFISKMEPHTVLDAEDGTKKFIYSLDDGYEIESVLIPETNRTTICISTQVGCPLACSFCVTGLGGVRRDLKTSEIIGQVQAVSRYLANTASEKRLTNIVVMGMGEPLLNFDNLVRALRICLYEDAFGFSHRKITVSTAGIVPKIDQLAKVLPVNLAVSLNATTNEQRKSIMPITKRYSIEELLDACRRYPLQNKKKITFEYVMLAGINDTIEDAARLYKLLKGIPAKVNLIPYNENDWSNYKRPSVDTIKLFQNYLVTRHLMAAVRWSRGPDIGAACGQLGVSRVRVDRYSYQTEDV